MDPDQESLLARPNQDRASLNQAGRFTIGTNGLPRVRRNLLLLTIVFFILICLGVYLYLNMQAIGSNNSGNQLEANRFKPLSRRKPMLDHESIFSDSGPTMLKLSDLLATCIVALQMAGQRVVNSSLTYNSKLKHIGSKGRTLEGVDDIVTSVDMDSHHIILRTIRDTYKRLKIISEEDNTNDYTDSKLRGETLPVDRQEFAKMLRTSLQEIEGEHVDLSSLVAQHETLVWIDPLDATKEYSENLTEYVTLMACIAYHSEPIAGVILKPFTNKLYWSMKDTSSGLYHHSPDLMSLFNTTGHELSHSNPLNMIVSRSHAGDVKAFLQKIYGDKAKIISAGGSGYKTIELLSGRVDVYIHLTRIKKWDVCGPHAIINSFAGGKMTNLQGKEIKFGDPKDKVIDDGLIASLEPDLHRQLVNLVTNSHIAKTYTSTN